MTSGSPSTRARWWEDEGDRDAATEQATPTPPAPTPPAPDPRPAGGGHRPLLWVAVALVAAVVAVAAGFTVHAATTPDGSPRPTPVARDADAPRREASGRDAPAVDAPRDLSGYVRAPCSLLENRQAGDLGYTRWSTRALPGGLRECRFTVGDPKRTLTLGALDGPDGAAFTDLYREPRPPVFVPLEIDGLPAVRTQAFVTSELCRVTVGVADGQSLRVETAVPDDRDGIPITDPCTRAERAAQEVVAVLPRER